MLLFYKPFSVCLLPFNDPALAAKFKDIKAKVWFSWLHEAIRTSSWKTTLTFFEFVFVWEYS